MTMLERLCLSQLDNGSHMEHVTGWGVVAWRHDAGSCLPVLAGHFEGGKGPWARVRVVLFNFIGVVINHYVCFFLGGGWEEEMNINEYKEKTIEILDVCILNFGGFPAVLLNLCRRFLLQPLRQVSKTCQPLATEVCIGLEHVAARWNLVELQEVLKQKSGDWAEDPQVLFAAEPKRHFHFFWSGEIIYGWKDDLGIKEERVDTTFYVEFQLSCEW